MNRPLNVWQKHGQICICLPDSTKDITIFVDVELNPGPTSRKSQSTESSRNATTTRRTYKTRPRLFSSYNLKCIVSNAQSLKSFKKIQDSDGQLRLAQNLHRFQDLVYSEDADIVCVNETWFNHTIDNHEVLHNGYTIYRKDRSEQRAGGVLIALKTEVFKSVREVSLLENLQDLEIVSATVTTATDQKILFCSCYRPESDAKWATLFNNFLDFACDKFENIVICGDFNFAKIPWDAPDCASGTKELLFVDSLNDHFLTQLNRKPTRDNNILDLVITNTPDHISVTDVLSIEQAGLFTDHRTILFEFNSFIKAPTKTHRTVLDFEKGDLEGLRSALSAINLSSAINNDDSDINTDWQQWKDTFLAAVSDYIPSKTLKGRNPVPWIDGTILNLIKKKNSVRQKMKKSPTNYLKEKFKALRSKIKHMLRERRNEFFGSLESKKNTNPKRFWSILKQNSKSHNLPNLVSAPAATSATVESDTQSSSRPTAENPQEIANLFNQYFASVFTTDDRRDDDDLDHKTDPPNMSDLCLITAKIQTVLVGLDVNKATGPDKISARLLKETSTEIAPSLCKLFNKSLRTGIVPQEWKEANVVPVFKKGEAEYVENYRPISLLSLVSKVLERCLLDSFKDQLYEIVKSCQHGFRNGKSCTSNLLEVLDYIGSMLDNGSQIDVVYMDMSKAFDKVCHRRLLYKLSEFGFGGNLLQWFRSYLTDRRQRVTALGATSDPLPVTSGVPQGSILGPALFLLYVNDLPDAVEESHIAMFADDTKLYKKISGPADADSLQADLNRLDTWASDSGLVFNKSKCKHQIITRKIKPTESSYSIKGNPLEVVLSERDLGVIISNNLTWNKQVLEQTSRANKLLGYIKRNTRYIQSIDVRRLMYLTLVRPLFGYATQIWAPQSVELICRIEQTQRRATKYILKLPFCSSVSYSDRLIALNILPVTFWHEYLDMVFFFKITHGLVKISSLIQPVPRRSRPTRYSNRNVIKYNVPKCKTVTYQKSFTIRTVRVWNSLSHELNLITDSLSSFKSTMLNYYFSALNNYDCNNPRTFKTICLKCNSARSLCNPISCCQ